MDQSRPLALAYARLGYARQLTAVCEDAIKRRGVEPLYVLLTSLGQAREGSYPAAIRGVETLKSRRDSEFAAHTALVVLHTCGGSPASAWAPSTAAKAAALERAPPTSLYLAALFLYLAGVGGGEAEELVERALGGDIKGNAMEVPLLALRGWLGASAGVAPGSRALPLHASSPSRLKAGVPVTPTKAHTDAATIAIPPLEAVVLPVPVASRDPEAVCALAALYERTGNFAQAYALLGECNAVAPWFLPAVAARGCTALRGDDWDGAWEAAVVLLEGDGDNVEGHRLATLCVMVREGPGVRAAARMDELAVSLLRVEPRAPKLLTDIARPLARLSGRSRGVLAGCIRLAEAASKAGSGWAGAEYACELGAARLLAGDSAGAARAYQEASRADEGDAGAVVGLIGVQVACGQWEDAAAQLDMFLMVSETLAGGKPPEVALLEARVAGARGARGEALEGLSEAVRAHGERVLGCVGYYPPPSPDTPLGKTIAAASAACSGGEKGWGFLPPLPPPTVDVHAYFGLLSPDLLLTISREYLVAGGEGGALGFLKGSGEGGEGCGGGSGGNASGSSSSGSGSGSGSGGSNSGGVESSPGFSPTPSLSLTLHPDAGDLASPCTVSGLAVLARLTSLVPAAMPAWLLTALTFSKCGEQTRAQSAIARVLASDPGYTEAHLLLAHTALLGGQGEVALASLETALAHNFGVREWGVYRLLKARALSAMKKYAEVCTLCVEALGGGGGRVEGGKPLGGRIRGGGAASAAGSAAAAAGGGAPSSSASASSSSASSSSSSSGGGGQGGSGQETQVTLSDRISLHILYAQALATLGKASEARGTLDEASALVSGVSGGGETTASALEDRVSVASASLFLTSGDVDGALEALEGIGPSSPSFPSARALLADIHLKHRRDVFKYLAVFTSAVALAKKDKSGVLRAIVARGAALEELGHAYLRVGEPEEAVDAYTEAKTERRAAAVAEAVALGASATAAFNAPPTAAEEELSRAIGKALVASHDYRRAVTFYQGVLATPSPPSTRGGGGVSVVRGALRADFTELLLKLHRLEQARGLIEDTLKEAGVPSSGSESGGEVKDVFALKFAVAGLRTLAKVQVAAREMEGARDALRQALAFQRRVLDAARGSSGRGGMHESKEGDEEMSNPLSAISAASSSSASASASSTTLGLSLEKEKRSASDICLELGVLLPLDEALNLYTDAVKLCEVSEEAHLALAGCALKRGDVEECRRSLTTVTALNPTSVRAAVMLSDVLFKEKDTRSAVGSLASLLEKQPTNYGVMLKLVLLLKREKRLPKELPKLLKAATKASITAPSDAGYKFMQAVCARAENEPALAVKLFNALRMGGGSSSSSSSGGVGGSMEGAGKSAGGGGGATDSASATPSTSSAAAAAASVSTMDWGVMAIEQMVRIYISPDSEPLWVLKEPDAPGDTSTADMLAEAERLLNDAPPAVQSSAKWEVLHCMILVATRTPESLDEAVTRLAAVLEADGDNIPALATLSAAFFNGGEPSKARNQLKRLLKLPAAGPGEFADESVDAWLMLAAINADSGKPDMAADCVQRALALDAGAGRAWEYLGTLAEKELRYADAAENYEKAWQCEGESSAPIGYKLAFNYLKAGRATAAIDVGKKVLAAFPEYPKIKEEVINKARSMLRM